MKVLKLIALSVAMLSTTVFAQTVSGVKVEPSTAKVGEPVKITIAFEPNETPNCGLRIHFGDGKIEKVKINKPSEMPYVITRSYAAAGQYTVDIEPTTAGTTLKCLGKRTSTLLTVAAPAPIAVVPAAPAASVAKAAPAKPATPCPEAWTLDKAGVNKKTQAFTCTAKAGTKIPEPKLVCPGDLTYFDNSKKGQLGCRI